jgi:pimeloyl-ACP methyl ester carboxylesterase
MSSAAKYEVRDVGVGVALEIVEAGTGSTTVVVVPGFGAGIGPYDSFVRALAGGCSVVGVSVRGFGRSAWAAPYAIADWVDDVVAVIREVARGPVVAVGHSFGACLALAAAALEPSRVRGVVSLDQIVDLDAFVPLAIQLNGYWQQVRRAAMDAAGDLDVLTASLAEVVGPVGRLGDVRSVEALRDMARQWSTQDPAVLDGMTDERADEWMNDPALADLARRVSCPILFVDGDPDSGSIVSSEIARRHLATFSGSRRLQIEGVGHQLGLDEAPSRIVDAIVPFLRDAF